VGSFEKGGGSAKDKWWTQVMLRKLIFFSWVMVLKCVVRIKKYVRILVCN
jgi:hypothetical protein